MPRASKRARVVSVAAVGALSAAWLGLRFAPWPTLVSKTHPEYSRVVYFADDTLLRGYLTSDQKWRFRVGELPRHAVDGLVCLEDKRFYSHPGVDPAALVRALRQNSANDRVVSGASTLTMQLARLMDPKPRTYSSKLIEVFEALALEARLSKRQILELYLTYAPFGANIEGIEAAAQRYFQKPARLLSAGETAFLYLLPQSPKRWDEADAPALQRLRSNVLKRWRDCGVLRGDAELARAENEPIPLYRSAFRDRAQHFADYVTARLPRQAGPDLKTTLQAGPQSAIEDYVAKAQARFAQNGVRNIGVVVVGNRDADVKALVGNFDYLSEGGEQKIPSFTAFRSTGSLLKPFLYAKLLELGEILPETLLEDVPLEVDGYEPSNYDGSFAGLVEAQLALSNSLNVPFVRELKRVGLDSFLDFLFQSDIKTNIAREKLGLSVIVGGLQATLLDLTKMYVALANGGRIRPLAYTLDGSVVDSAPSRDPVSNKLGWQWIHPGAVILTDRALAIRGRPDFAIDPRYLSADPDIHWKTGTSQNRRDAWAIGFNREFTVGVWLGNLDNEPSPALVGAEAAAPVMFDVFGRLRKDAGANGRAQEERLAELDQLENVEVCAFSGLAPGDGCPLRKTVQGIRGQVPRRRCPYHERFLVDAKTGLRITQDCEKPGMQEELRAFVTLPADVSLWAAKNYPNLPMTPPFHPGCDLRPVEKGRLKILVPAAASHYLIHDGGPKTKLHLPLRLSAPDLLTDYKCYLNGDELKFRNGDFDRVLTIGVGTHELFCVDRIGRSDLVRFEVEL